MLVGSRAAENPGWALVGKRQILCARLKHSLALTNEDVMRWRRWKRVLERASLRQEDGGTVANRRRVVLEKRPVEQMHSAIRNLVAIERGT